MDFMSGGGNGYSGPASGWWWVESCILIGVVRALMMGNGALVLIFRKTSPGSWLFDTVLHLVLSVLPRQPVIFPTIIKVKSDRREESWQLPRACDSLT
jgi:hypothetical protein